jgi:hypothetical protein
MNFLLSSAVAVILSMAHSVVNDVNFDKITDTAMTNRKYSTDKLNMIEKTIKHNFDRGINLSKAANQEKILKLLRKEIVFTPATSLREVDFLKIRQLTIRMMQSEFISYNESKIRQNLYKKAEELYKCFNEGDIVTIHYRFCGKLTSVTGRLHNIKLYENVSVDNTVVSFVDMDETQQKLFVLKSVEMLRDRYVESRFKELEHRHYYDQKDYLETQYAKLLEQAFRQNEKNGYFYNVKVKQWWSANFAFRHYLNYYSGKQKQIMKKRINEALTDLGLDSE